MPARSCVRWKAWVVTNCGRCSATPIVIAGAEAGAESPPASASTAAAVATQAATGMDRWRVTLDIVSEGQPAPNL